MASVTTNTNTSNQPNYYDILGVSPTARLIEIKKAFRTLQRKVHPDSSKSDSTRSQSAKLNEAYQILSNSLSRLEYDLKHGFKEKSTKNLSKLDQLKKRKAQKVRENMSASAARSRDIESNVTSTLSNNTKIKNCGLIITKAKYGLIDLEQKQRRNLITNTPKMPSAHPPSLKRYNTITDSNNMFHKRKRSKLKQKDDVNTGYDSATESVNKTNSIQANIVNIEYTIDVTEALQCMVTHRGQNGGYIEIEDNYDKSKLEGFYDPYPKMGNIQDRYLEVEYMFNRKYHYVKVNNFEYFCIPNQSHIVYLFDANNDDQESADSIIESEEDEKTESVAMSIDKNIVEDEKQKNIIKRAHSFTTFSPVAIQPATNTLFGSKQFNFGTIMASTSAVKPPPMNGDIITLPSGKRAIQHRPSLSGLKKFSEIEKLRKDEKVKYDEIPQTTSNHNNDLRKLRVRKRIIKWSIGVMVVGAIGGLGYYYVDKIQRNKHNNGNNNDGNDGNHNDGVFGYLWQDSVISYIQKYWNWMMGINVNLNESDIDNNKYTSNEPKTE